MFSRPFTIAVILKAAPTGLESFHLVDGYSGTAKNTALKISAVCTDLGLHVAQLSLHDRL